MIRVPPFVRMREDYVGAQRVDQIRDLHAQLRQAECGLAVYEAKRDQSIRGETGHFHRLLELDSPSLGILLARFETVTYRASGIARRTVGDVDEVNIPQVPQAPPRAERLIIGVCHDDQSRERTVPVNPIRDKAIDQLRL